MTIIEIIISISLVSVVLVFMVNLLITVKNSTDSNQEKSSILVNQAILTREIENEFINFHIKYIDDCSLNDKKKFLPSGVSNVYCLSIKYDSSLVDDNLAFLYQYQDGDKNIIGYRRGSNQVVRESFVKMDPTKHRGIVSYTCINCSSCIEGQTLCAININLPVIDEENNDYSVNASYFYTYGDYDIWFLSTPNLETTNDGVSHFYYGG